MNRIAVCLSGEQLPVAVFQKAVAGQNFPVKDRIASWLWKVRVGPRAALGQTA